MRTRLTEKPREWTERDGLDAQGNAEGGEDQAGEGDRELALQLDLLDVARLAGDLFGIDDAVQLGQMSSRSRPSVGC